jgi:hypothetical protein
MKISGAALHFAVGELGKGEIGGNNAGPTIQKYLEGFAEPPANWCAAFISWCYYMASRDDVPFTYTLSARALFNEFKHKAKPGISLVDIPGPGDLMFFWRGSKNSWMGHVAMVEKTDDKYVYVIEGNIGKFPSQVKRSAYPRNPSTLLGFGRVKE